MAAISSDTQPGLADATPLEQALQTLADVCAVAVVLWVPQGSLVETWVCLPTSPAVERLRIPDYPAWWLSWQEAPQPYQLTTGDLVLPLNLPDRPSRFVLQVHKSSAPPLAMDALLDDAIALQPDCSDWSEAEQAALQHQARAVALTIALVHEGERLAQAQQRAALMGRIVHLLNSNLDAPSILRQVLAEVGQFCEGDRSFLVDLRNPNTPTLTASWSDLDDSVPAFDPATLPEALWSELLELFLQDGASYLSIQAESPEPESASDLCTALQAKSVWLVPVFVQAEFFGILGLVALHEEHSYPLETVQVIHQVADHAAIALAQMRVPLHPRLTPPERRPDTTLGTSETWQDNVTGLANRDALDKELDHLSNPTLWAVEPSFCILLGDLDYFKLINDTHGYPIGDEVLQEVAKRLQSQLRQGTPLYRYDGEEFLIILTDTTLHQAADVAERLRATVQHPRIQTEAGFVEVTLSFGVACRQLPQDTSARVVLERAEAALKDAKRQGRNRVKVL